MTLPRTVAEVLSEHVVFEVECIDRMYLNVYVPAVAARWRPGELRAPPARPPGRLHRPACEDYRPVRCRRCAASPTVSASRGWTSPRGSARTTSCMSTWPRSRPRARPRACCSSAGRRRRPRCSGRKSAANGDGRSYPWIVKTTGLVNHFYVYCVDADFGPFFIKFCSYFPCNAKLCINGNHWAQRQAARAGIGFEALDNGFAAVSDPAALQADLRSAGTRADRRAAAQVAGHPAAPVHRRRPGRRLPLRHLHRAGRVLPHPDAGQAGVREGSSSSRSSATTWTPGGPTRSA